MRLIGPINTIGPIHYSSDPKLRGGQDVSLKMTEVFDGYTDEFGVFKEGPPSTLRLEYLRQPFHLHQNSVLERFVWNPFECPDDMRQPSSVFYEGTGFSGRDYWGHRALDGAHYKKREFAMGDHRYRVNHMPQFRVPKWLATVVHDRRRRRFLGFFLYANGAYCCELLTYKQLPRLAYNKPFQGFMPTIGQAVDLSEVTYGKEVHSLEKYPGYGGAVARHGGSAAVVLRGSEPNLVPMMMPSREVRLFDTAARAVFGRRAGVMYKKARLQEAKTVKALNPRRPGIRSSKRSVHEHPHGGGGGQKMGAVFKVDWSWKPITNLRSRYWLNAYVVKTSNVRKISSVSDIKSKTYSWASRDPVPR